MSGRNDLLVSGQAAFLKFLGDFTYAKTLHLQDFDTRLHFRRRARRKRVHRYDGRRRLHDGLLFDRHRH